MNNIIEKIKHKTCSNLWGKCFRKVQSGRKQDHEANSHLDSVDTQICIVAGCNRKGKPLWKQKFISGDKHLCMGFENDFRNHANIFQK